MKPIHSMSRLGIIAVIAWATLPCLAATEVAVLKNGFAIRHERRETMGDVTRLYVNADGSSFVDIPTAQLDHIEAAPELPASAVKNPVGGSGVQSTSSSLPRTGSGASPLGKIASGAHPSAPVPTRAASRVNITEVVKDASGRYQLDPDLVDSVIKAESGFNVRARSPKGAQGLMQLMPGTATQLGVPNAYDPEANVDGGTKYLRELLERYNFDIVKALAAYNAGPQRVERFGGVPPYYETRAYVARIVKDFNKKKLAQQKAAAAAAKKTAPPAKGVQAHAPAAKQSPTKGAVQAKSSTSAGQ
jgi:hypothetical protein